MPIFFYPMLFWYIVLADSTGKRRERPKEQA